MRKQILTQARLKEVLSYDPATGFFTWLENNGLNGKKGAAAGSKGKSGYVAIQVDGRQYLAHRLAWLYVTGSWPAKLIDHRDSVEWNNAWENLRAATNAENQQNRAGLPSNNTSGYLGVTWSEHHGRWLARITVNGKARSLGQFRTAKLAGIAYYIAKRNLHPFG